MTVQFWRFSSAVSLCGAALLIGACSASPKQDAAAVPVGFRYDPPKSKTDPDIVEETSGYFIRRYLKSQMVRVGENRVRPAMLGDKGALLIYREDDKYYYIRTEKLSPEEIEAARKKSEEKEKAKPEKVAARENAPVLTDADFESIAPPRARSGVRFVKAGRGLPEGGQWRENIAVADIDGDGFPDIVASPNRVSSGGTFYLFRGDGHGNFREQEIEVVDESGKPVKVGTGYGGVAVADFDGDGKLDVATASHGGGIHVFLQRDRFHFVLADKGLPKKFSSRVVTAFDADGDGKPDLVVAADEPDQNPDRQGTATIDMHQVRLYRNAGAAGWTYEENAISGGYYSNHLFPIRLDGDRAPSFLSAANYLGGTFLGWRNDGKGGFKGFSFDGIESSSYHLAVAPGTFGKEKLPAFADLYVRREIGTPRLAAGVSVYVDRAGTWTRVPVWRENKYGSGHVVSVAMGDLDGDGLDDVVFPDFLARRLRIFYQTADGKFVEAPEALEPALGSAVCDVRLADVNGDGRLDIVLAETTYSERPEDKGGFEVFLSEGK